VAVRIPTYDARLTPSGQMSARASATPVDGSVGRALGNLGQTVDRATDEYIRNVAEARVRELDNEASDGIRARLYGRQGDDGTMSEGYYSATGKSAITGRAAVEEDVRKLQRDLAARATNGVERRMLEQVLSRRVESALGGISTHAAQQAKVYNAGQAKARAQLAMADAVANDNDPEQFNRARATMVTEATFGLTGAEADLAARDALTTMHGEVIMKMLSQNRNAMAREHFARWQGEIDPTKHDEIRSRLETAGIKEDSLNLSMQLSTLGGVDAQRAALKKRYADGSVSAEVYDATMTRISAAEVDAKRRQAEWKDAMEGRAQEWLLRNPSASVLDLPPDLLNYARANGRFSSLAQFQRTGGAPQGDVGRYTELFLLAAEKPSEFVQAFDQEKEALRTQLSPQQYNSILSARASISKADAKAQDVLKVASATIKNLQADLRRAGINSTPRAGSPEAEQFAAFNDALLASLQAEAERNGGQLKPEAARQVGLSLLREGRLMGSGFIPGFDERKRVFELSTEEKAQYPFVDDQSALLYQRLANDSKLRAKLGVSDLKNADQVNRALDLLVQRAKAAGVQF